MEFRNMSREQILEYLIKKATKEQIGLQDPLKLIVEEFQWVGMRFDSLFGDQFWFIKNEIILEKGKEIKGSMFRFCALVDKNKLHKFTYNSLLYLNSAHPPSNYTLTGWLAEGIETPDFIEIDNFIISCGGQALVEYHDNQLKLGREIYE
ncbi:MAG TPA: hypothetical protein VGK47_09370 [Nitrososphaeraceae archaeon]